MSPICSSVIFVVVVLSCLDPSNGRPAGLEEQQEIIVAPAALVLEDPTDVTRVKREPKLLSHLFGLGGHGGGHGGYSGSNSGSSSAASASAIASSGGGHGSSGASASSQSSSYSAGPFTASFSSSNAQSNSNSGGGGGWGGFFDY